ncbi:polyadenylate-binding protein 3-like [Cucurbita pepo subsp. pepo]|uniref:polyadenylate-binding protein 3-like n=1 Tax=Cucurbita pepo subsp. pepo TaxID=3664 RepID=UPI000C9D2A45|nr:polyadenylate-binding protein 3-like [Cucurbita pepo subsp. pepo]
MAAMIPAPVISAPIQTAVIPPPVGSVPTGEVFLSSSLYVGDLELNVNEAQLLELFSRVAQVVSLRVCRDQTRRVSLGYGYVNFSNHQDAMTAMEHLNFTSINGKPIRIMISNRDPSIRKSGYANVFIKNLDASIDNKALHDTFASFGTVLSCKVALDSNGQSKGYGFVQFDTKEAAESAIIKLNGMLLNDKQVYVGHFIRRQERMRANGLQFTNVYVKNLPENMMDDGLKSLFGVHGTITSAVVKTDSNGKSKGFGFVNFESTDSAAAAVEKLNGTLIGEDKILYVGKAQRKAEREAELKEKFERDRKIRFDKLQGANLYIKNLDDHIDDEKLKELFSEYGTITSCKVMLDENGVSKGTGFVAFSSPDDAARAINEMNRKMKGRKPLYVAVAQRKEERKAQLQTQFAQIRVASEISSLTSGMPGFHPGAHRLAPQQLYYGQGNPGLVPPPPGYSFQPQLMNGMRPSMGPNFIMPYQFQRQVQPGPRSGIRRGGNSQPVHQQQQQQQQQLMLRGAGQGYRYMNNARNGLEPPVLPHGLVGPMMPLAFDSSGMSSPPIDIQRSRAVPTSTLASALASATPTHQRLMLGEQLYPLVERLEPTHAAKVTGMLLEMDQPEVLHLIEPPDDLKNKVAEAMEVLRKASSEPDLSDQLGSLVLTK